MWCGTCSHTHFNFGNTNEGQNINNSPTLKVDHCLVIGPKTNPLRRRSMRTHKPHFTCIDTRANPFFAAITPDSILLETLPLVVKGYVKCRHPSTSTYLNIRIGATTLVLMNKQNKIRLTLQKCTLSPTTKIYV